MLRNRVKQSELLECPFYWLIISLPMSILFLYYPIQGYLDQPLEEPLLEVKSVFKKGSSLTSKYWTWIEVNDRQFRCSGKGIDKVVVYQKTNPNKCRVKNTLAFPNDEEWNDLLIGILLVIITIIKTLAIPKWIKRRREAFFRY